MDIITLTGTDGTERKFKLLSDPNTRPSLVGVTVKTDGDYKNAWWVPVDDSATYRYIGSTSKSNPPSPTYTQLELEDEISEANS